MLNDYCLGHKQTKGVSQRQPRVEAICSSLLSLSLSIVPWRLARGNFPPEPLQRVIVITEWRTRERKKRRGKKTMHEKPGNDKPVVSLQSINFCAHFFMCAHFFLFHHHTVSRLMCFAPSRLRLPVCVYGPFLLPTAQQS